MHLQHHVLVDPFTGAASVTIPVTCPACRGFTPDLALTYHSGAGDGVFGRGFALSLPSIVRDVARHYPGFDASDSFIFSALGEIVPLQVRGAGGYSRSPAQRREWKGVVYSVVRFRARHDGLGFRIERWTPKDGGAPHWQVRSATNVTSIFGLAAEARIAAAPNDAERVAVWLLQSTSDARGNEVVYDYRLDASDGSGTMRHPSRMRYGRICGGSEDDWHFEVQFDYSGRTAADFAAGKAGDTEQADAPDRADTRSNFRSGFERRTARLCNAILVKHRIGTEALSLVRALHLEYGDCDGQTVLQKVVEAGYRPIPAEPGSAESGPQVRARPPLRLRYTGGAASPRFVPLVQKGHAEGRLHLPIKSFVDLDGDGLPGLLQGNEQVTLYARPLGAGCFAAPEPPGRFPKRGDLLHASYAFLDLTGDGRQDLVLEGPGGSGYFAQGDDGGWAGFRPFPGYPTAAFSAPCHRVDLTGDERADLVIFERGSLTFYPSLGTEGFGPAQTCATPDDFPDMRHLLPDEHIGFADMFGDGGNHLVRVRDREVTVWPCLGRGKFDRARPLARPPDFGGPLDPGRLLLADTTGSGTADILYAGPKGLAVYRNLGGQRFAPPYWVDLPGDFSMMDVWRLADVTGSGRACVVRTSLGPDLGPEHAYCDFSGGVMGPLLANLDTSMGLKTEITHASATSFAIADREAGRRWRTPVPMSVVVVTSIRTTDEIARSSLVTRRAYHDGYFDAEQRTFRGFGYVEEWNGPAPDGPAGAQPATESDPMLWQRTWFHTGSGATTQSPLADSRFRPWTGDPVPPRAPDDEFEPGGDMDDTSADLAEAGRALAGLKVRQEIYAGGAHPHEVRGFGHMLRRLQPAAEGMPNCLAVLPREEMTALYGGTHDDPRITRRFTLETNAFGQITRSCLTHTPRRPGRGALSEAEQVLPRASVRVVRYGVAIDTARDHLAPLPAEETVWELALPCSAEHEADWPAAAKAAAAAEAGQGLAGPLTRLLSRARHFYWDRALKAAVAPDDPILAPQALAHHSAFAVLEAARVGKIYGDKVDATALSGEAGLKLSDGIWWAEGPTHYYASRRSGFFLPRALVDPAGLTTTLRYDTAKLVLVSIRNNLGHAVRYAVDPVTHIPTSTTDINGVTTEVLLDPLGHVVAHSRYGHEPGVSTGANLLHGQRPPRPDSGAALLDDPAHYLGGADSVFCHDFGDWSIRRIPPHVASVHREDRTAEPACDPLSLAVNYFDGSGRPSLEKRRESTAWTASGWADRDAHGLPSRLYPAWFASGPDFAPPAASLVPHETALHDPLGRLCQIVRLDGAITAFGHGPWLSEMHDANDTSQTSPHSATPERHHLNVQGQVFRIDRLLDPKTPVSETYSLDIAGRTLAATNALGALVLEQDHDLAGRVVRQASTAAGTRWVLRDARGAEVHSWDSRNIDIATRHDALGRPVTVTATAAEPGGLTFGPAVVERHAYGGTSASARRRNLCGRLVRSLDQAGERCIEGYSLTGQPLAIALRVCRTPEAVTDWRDGWDADLLEPASKALEVRYRYDALGRVTLRQWHDGSALCQSYLAGGGLAALMLERPGAEPQPVVSALTRDAEGRRLSAQYGNGVQSTFAYDPASRLLAALDTNGPDGAVLQSLRYAHDPVGNVISACENEGLTPGAVRYAYDALYRLESATEETSGAVARFGYDPESTLVNLTDAGATAAPDWAVARASVPRATAQGTPGDTDAHGNVIRLPGLPELRWDYRDKLAASGAGPSHPGAQMLYAYSAAGERVRQLVCDADGKRLWERIHLDDFTLVRRYAGADEPSVVEAELGIEEGGRWIAQARTPLHPQASSPRLSFLLSDYVGSIRAVLDDTGRPVATETYTPFGESRGLHEKAVAEPEGSRTRRHFGGHERDETGLYRMGARYYSTQLGRWLSPDPSGNVEGLNLFAYVGNNPASLADATGHVGEKNSAASGSAAPSRERRNAVIIPMPPPPRVLGFEVSHMTLNEVSYNPSLFNRALLFVILQSAPKMRERSAAIGAVYRAGKDSLNSEAAAHHSTANAAVGVARAAAVASAAASLLGGAGMIGSVVGAGAHIAAAASFGEVAGTMATDTPAEQVFHDHMQYQQIGHENDAFPIVPTVLLNALRGQRDRSRGIASGAWMVAAASKSPALVNRHTGPQPAPSPSTLPPLSFGAAPSGSDAFSHDQSPAPDARALGENSPHPPARPMGFSTTHQAHKGRLRETSEPGSAGQRSHPYPAMAGVAHGLPPDHSTSSGSPLPPINPAGSPRVPPWLPDSRPGTPSTASSVHHHPNIAFGSRSKRNGKP